MKKNLIMVLIGVLLVVVCFFLFIQSNVSVQEKICNAIKKAEFGCEKVLHIDLQTNLVFYQNDTNLMFAIVDDTIQKGRHVRGFINLEGFKNAGAIFDWQGTESESEDHYILYGLASDEVKSIIIESEGSSQPNKIYIGEGIWLWYLELETKMNLPIAIKALDESGNVLN